MSVDVPSIQLLQFESKELATFRAQSTCSAATLTSRKCCSALARVEFARSELATCSNQNWGLLVHEADVGS